MAFLRLNRANIRKLRVGHKISEGGITAEKLHSGDVRYSINIMVDGQRIHRVVGRESEGVNRTQAEQVISQKRTEARESRLSLPRGRKLGLTFAAAAVIYLRKLREIEGKDYTSNEQHLRMHLVPYFGSMRIDKISTFTIEKFRTSCRGRELSGVTINRILATFRRMGKRLVAWRDLPTALPHIQLEPENNARTYVISYEEETELLAAALQDSNPYIWLFIVIGLATGLRHREILSLRFDGFDPMRRRIKVQTKRRVWRQQPLTISVADVIGKERHMANDQNGWIFPSNKTKTGHINQISDAFERCVRRASLDPRSVTPHTMRHTAVTRLAAAGADFKTIQEFSGHESLQMVMRYAHPQQRAIDDALDRMEKAFISEHSANKNRRQP